MKINIGKKKVNSLILNRLLTWSTSFLPIILWQNEYISTVELPQNIIPYCGIKCLPRGCHYIIGTFSAVWVGLWVPVKLKAMLVGLPKPARSQPQKQVKCVPKQQRRRGGLFRSATPTLLALRANHPHTQKNNIYSETKVRWMDWAIVLKEVLVKL